MRTRENGYIINISQPLSCRDTGKFEAPSPEWRHDALALDDTYELCVVTKGILYLKYRGESYSIYENQFLLLGPHEAPDNVRRGYNSSQCDFYWLHFYPPSGMRRTDLESVDFSELEAAGEIVIPDQGTLMYPEKVAIFMRQLQDTIRSNYSFIEINYLATLILCEISNQISMQKNDAEVQTLENAGIYNSIIDYIDENLDKDLKLKTIAYKFNYNEQYIARLFKNSGGVSLHQYILNRKISQANYYLSETSFSIKEIARMVGYHDSHNFMKIYKRETGMTPSEYRNSFPNKLRYES